MSKQLFILLLSFSSFFSFSNESNLSEEISRFNERNQNFLKECIKHKEEVLAKTYKELETDQIINDEVVVTTLSEQNAVKKLALFSPEILHTPQYEQFLKKFANSCPKMLSIDQNPLKEIQVCNFVFEEMNFFKSMIFSSKNNHWNTDNKKILVDKVFQTIDQVLIRGKSNIISYLIYGDILGTLAEYDLIPKTNLNQIKKYRVIAEKLSSDYSSIEKTDKEKNDCIRLQNKIANELKTRDKIKSIFSTMFKTITR